MIFEGITMTKGIRISLIVGIVIASMISYRFFNIIFLEPLLIPDHCYFDMHETTFLVEIFFDFPAYEGYHPVPSTIGYLVFGLIGGFVGYKILKIKSESK